MLLVDHLRCRNELDREGTNQSHCGLAREGGVASSKGRCKSNTIRDMESGVAVAVNLLSREVLQGTGSYRPTLVEKRGKTSSRWTRRRFRYSSDCTRRRKSLNSAALSISSSDPSFPAVTNYIEA
jgi:hypothetical protein